MDNKGPLTLMTSCMTHHQCARFLEDQSAKCLFGDTRVVYESHNPKRKHRGGCTPFHTTKLSFCNSVFWLQDNLH